MVRQVIHSNFMYCRAATGIPSLLKMKGLHIDKDQMDVNIPYNDDFVSVLSQSVGAGAPLSVLMMSTRIQNSFI